MSPEMSLPERLLFICFIILSPYYIPRLYSTVCYIGKGFWDMIIFTQRNPRVLNGKFDDIKKIGTTDAIYFITGIIILFFLAVMANMFI